MCVAIAAEIVDIGINRRSCDHAARHLKHQTFVPSVAYLLEKLNLATTQCTSLVANRISLELGSNF